MCYSINVDEAIKSTIEKNPKVKIAYEKLTESKELIENAYNQKLPTITSTISGTYSKSDSATSTATTDTSILGIPAGNVSGEPSNYEYFKHVTI